MFKRKHKTMGDEAFGDNEFMSFRDIWHGNELINPYKYAYRDHVDELETLADIYGFAHKNPERLAWVIQNIVEAFLTGNKEVIEGYQKSTIANKKVALKALKDFDANKIMNRELEE